MTFAVQCMKLDYLLLKPYLKSVLLVLLVPLIFPFFTGTLFEGLSFAATVMAMTTGYAFSVVEKNGFDRFYGFLPVKKSALVVGRYLILYAMGFSALLISSCAQSAILHFSARRPFPCGDDGNAPRMPPAVLSLRGRADSRVLSLRVHQGKDVYVRPDRRLLAVLLRYGVVCGGDKPHGPAPYAKQRLSLPLRNRFGGARHPRFGRRLHQNRAEKQGVRRTNGVSNHRHSPLAAMAIVVRNMLIRFLRRR